MIEAEVQHIHDVSSAKVYGATRTIRSIERLSREGDAILWIDGREELKRRRYALQTLVDDAALQDDSDVRALVVSVFKVIDTYLAERDKSLVKARPDAVTAWKPVMQDLFNRTEAEGAMIAELATQEADRILSATGRARTVFF